jgi:hypothetical protein
LTAWFSGVNEYQTSGLVTGGVLTRPGSTDGPPPTFQRDSLTGPWVGSEHSNFCGGSSSGVLVLKFQR